MPRYLVERTFAGDWDWTEANGRPSSLEGVAGANLREGVTWIHSYVTPNRQRSFCIVESASPQAVRVAALACGLPVDRITEVRLLFPHFLL
jgi:Protein of unknown function (DUF4242)